MNDRINKFILRYSHIFIYVVVFLLIFFNGRRLNTVMSLIYASVDTLFFAIMYQIFCRLLTTPPNWLQNKALKFFVVILLWLLSCQLLFASEYLIHNYVPIERPKPNSEFLPFITLANFLKVLIINLFALSLAIYKYSVYAMRQAEQLKQEQKLMKLQLLQSQINPHFLFNALNNIYALVYTKSDIAPDALMKLSDMLRYVTDFGQQEKVPVEKELSYIQNYVDFQVLRMGTPDKIDYQLQQDSQAYSIVPMLLQPFAENCFTHSDLLSNPEAFVRVKIEIRQGSLFLHTENTVSKTHISHETSKENSIGIDNVEQRLHLYYPEDHTLTIGEDKGIYKVDLTIKL